MKERTVFDLIPHKREIEGTMADGDLDTTHKDKSRGRSLGVSTKGS